MATAPGWALVVDDSLGDVDLLREAFAEAGLPPDHLAVARDAREAQARLDERHPHGPCLILCDCHLPAQSGVEFCRALRADARFASVPFMLMSGVALPSAQLPPGVPVWVKCGRWNELLAFVRRVREAFFDDYGTCKAAAG